MAVVVLEVPGDGLWAGVQSGVTQFLADPDYEVDYVGREGTGRSLGAA
jgi:hypothetical protein